MNVLLTSVGRRAYLVKYFREAVGKEGRIFVGNSTKESVALRYADDFVLTPLIYSEEYIPFLLNYCKEKKIDLMLSLFDIDQLVLAKNKEKFESLGTKVVVAPVSTVEVCNDKWKTFLFLKENGFAVPKSYLSSEDVKNDIQKGNLSYPIVVKPRFGCGSLSVEMANDEEDLHYLVKKVDRGIRNSYLKYESACTNQPVLFQECLKGQEYGADIINDLNGNFQATVIRKKLAMRSGETDIAEIVDEPMIRQALEKLGKLTKHLGNMDCDIFIANGVPYILEMNSRFGGGYPFSHLAGCNLPLAIVKWAKGEAVDASLLTAKVGVKGYKEILMTKEE